jgi:hypothetical protein
MAVYVLDSQQCPVCNGLHDIWHGEMFSSGKEYWFTCPIENGIGIISPNKAGTEGHSPRKGWLEGFVCKAGSPDGKRRTPPVHNKVTFPSRATS